MLSFQVTTTNCLVMTYPLQRPSQPCFSSGPTAKYPGWSLSSLDTGIMGRSHRSKGIKDLIESIKARQIKLLGIPEDWECILMPASDTGAFEAAMWTMLGARGIDVLVWDSFGSGWVEDIRTHLKLKDVRILSADYGALPDLRLVDSDRDIVFTWNGTTSGVCVPNADWISKDRQGLVFCDATSAVFAMDLDWDKCDVVTWSWQKALGGEAQHGMLALSPRAKQRLCDYRPDRPLPKIFRLAKNGKLLAGLFGGDTINTPSLLALSDYDAVLDWAVEQGDALKQRPRDSLAAIAEWVDVTPWAHFLCQDPANRSCTSVCLTLQSQDTSLIKGMTSLLAEKDVAYDIQSYRDAPPGLRIWCGPTILSEDVRALMPWLTWSYHQVLAPA